MRRRCAPPPRRAGGPSGSRRRRRRGTTTHRAPRRRRTRSWRGWRYAPRGRRLRSRPPGFSSTSAVTRSRMRGREANRRRARRSSCRRWLPGRCPQASRRPSSERRRSALRAAPRDRAPSGPGRASRAPARASAAPGGRRRRAKSAAPCPMACRQTMAGPSARRRRRRADAVDHHVAPGGRVAPTRNRAGISVLMVMHRITRLARAGATGQDMTRRHASPTARPRRGAPADDPPPPGRRGRARVFNRDGFHGTDSNRIARAAGYAPGSFYKHFADKRAIFLEAWEAWVTAEWAAVRDRARIRRRRGGRRRAHRDGGARAPPALAPLPGEHAGARRLRPRRAQVSPPPACEAAPAAPRAGRARRASPRERQRTTRCCSSRSSACATRRPTASCGTSVCRPPR